MTETPRGCFHIAVKPAALHETTLLTLLPRRVKKPRPYILHAAILTGVSGSAAVKTTSSVSVPRPWETFPFCCKPCLLCFWIIATFLILHMLSVFAEYWLLSATVDSTLLHSNSARSDSYSLY